MTIKTNGRTIYYDECNSASPYYVLDDEYDPRAFPTLQQAKDYAARANPQKQMRWTVFDRDELEHLRELLTEDIPTNWAARELADQLQAEIETELKRKSPNQ